MTIYLPGRDDAAVFGPPLDPLAEEAAAVSPRPEVTAALDHMQAEDDALARLASGAVSGNFADTGKPFSSSLYVMSDVDTLNVVVITKNDVAAWSWWPPK